jgi:hypothetical protein
MIGSLILDLNADSLNIGWGSDGSLFFMMSYGVDSKIKIKNCVKRFLVGHDLSSKNIDRVILRFDIDNFFNELKQTQDLVIGYIKLSQSDTSPEQFSPFINKAGAEIETRTIDYNDQEIFERKLKRILTEFQNRNIRHIAINSYYSLSEANIEQELISHCRKIVGDHFSYHSINPFISPNFLVHENTLLINTIFKDIVYKILNEIKSVITEFQFPLPLLVASADGSLTDQEQVLDYPFLTWQSGLTAKAIGAGIYTNNTNAIIILPYKNGLQFGVLKDRKALTTNELNVYKGVQLCGEYPLLVNLAKIPNQEKLLNILETLNPCLGCVPLLNFSGQKLPPLNLSYPIDDIENSSKTKLLGVLNSRYKYTQEKLVRFSTKKEKQAKIDQLLDEAKAVLKSKQIVLSQPKYIIKEVIPKYLNTDYSILTLQVSEKI